MCWVMSKPAIWKVFAICVPNKWVLISSVVKMATSFKSVCVVKRPIVPPDALFASLYLDELFWILSKAVKALFAKSSKEVTVR